MVILKRLHDKHNTIINKNQEIYGAYRQKNLPIDFEIAPVMPSKDERVPPFKNVSLN